LIALSSLLNSRLDNISWVECPVVKNNNTAKIAIENAEGFWL
jgi:hypothetical protein